MTLADAFLRLPSASAVKSDQTLHSLSKVDRGPSQADGRLSQTIQCHVRPKEGTLRPTKGFLGPPQSPRRPT